MTRVWWASVPAGDEQCFVYSPRFGRTYLVSNEVAASAVFSRVLGLSPSNHHDGLLDPATSVDLAGAFEKPLQSLSDSSDAGRDADAGRYLRSLYLFFHRHRAIASIRRATHLAKLLARLNRSRRPYGPAEIGRTVMAVERAVGISDCYPRALLTAYLCLTARLSCEITVGILAPTAKLHAWCSTEGSIPYEPVRRYWWYQPLVVFDVT